MNGRNRLIMYSSTAIVLSFHGFDQVSDQHFGVECSHDCMSFLNIESSQYCTISTVSSRIPKICWPRWPINFLLSSSDLKQGLFSWPLRVTELTVEMVQYTWSWDILYARIKVHSHASHTPLSCALSGICHASQASMCNLRRMSHVLNSLKIPIYGNFSGASRHPCALCWLCHRSRHQLCTICRASHTRCLVHLYPCIQ